MPSGREVRGYFGPRVTHALADIISKTSGIKAYEAGNCWGVLLEDCDLIPGYSEYSYRMKLNDTETKWMYSPEQIETTMDLTDAYSTHNSEYFEQFYNGNMCLKKGRHILPDDEKVALISSELAERNQLVIGDTLVLGTSSFNSGGDYPVKSIGDIEVTIVGLFDTTYKQAVSELTNENDILSNWVIVDSETDRELAEFSGWNDDRVSYNTFWVEDPSMLNEVMEEVQKIDSINWKYYTLEKDDSGYQDAAAPLRTIKVIMAVTLGVIVAAGIALFYLVLTHSVKKREREAGILLALGISGKEIRRQFIIENMILGIAAYVAALLLSIAVAPALGNQLLHTLDQGKEQKIYTQAEVEAAIRRGDYSNLPQMTSNQRTGIEVPETINVHLDIWCIGLVALAETVIILWGVINALDKTLRWEPVRVLSMIR